MSVTGKVNYEAIKQAAGGRCGEIISAPSCALTGARRERGREKTNSQRLFISWKYFRIAVIPSHRSPVSLFVFPH